MPDHERYELGTPFLRMERQDHLAWCTIDRPGSRNALSAAMYFGLKRAVQIVNARSEPTALIVTGVDDVFAPGGELRGRVEDPNPLVEQLGVDEVLRIGLVSRVVPHERLRDEAVAAAEGILRTAPEARLHVKRILHERYGRVDRMTMDWSLFRGPEAREGMQAFAEKRAPGWVPKALQTARRR